MATQHILTFAFMSLAISSTVSECGMPKNEVQLALPTREKCIVKVVIDRAEISNLSHFTDLRREAYAANIPLAAFRVQKPRSIYLQFKSSCDQKQELSRKLMLSYLEKHSLQMTFEVSDKLVHPSTTTIDVTGPDWRE